MNRKMTIWGREFDIKIIFDVFSDEKILPEQVEALESFCNVMYDLLADSTEIEKYCIKNNRIEIGDTVSNIFKYVIPTSLLVKRETRMHKVALLCDYKFDEEHGIALIYENEELVHISSQDNV